MSISKRTYISNLNTPNKVHNFGFINRYQVRTPSYELLPFPLKAFLGKNIAPQVKQWWRKHLDPISKSLALHTSFTLLLKLQSYSVYIFKQVNCKPGHQRLFLWQMRRAQQSAATLLLLDVISSPNAAAPISTVPCGKQGRAHEQNSNAPFKNITVKYCTSLYTPQILICRRRRLTCENWRSAKQTQHLHIHLSLTKPTTSLSKSSSD